MGFFSPSNSHAYKVYETKATILTVQIAHEFGMLSSACSEVRLPVKTPEES